MTSNYCIITFYSTHLALRFEKLLKENTIAIKIIPVPRQISASCGLAGRFHEEDLEAIQQLLNETSFEYDDLYLKNENDYMKIETKNE